MAQPVWTLSVDLQARTATFVSGMGDAAKGARSSFQDIKAGANEMARETGYSMMEARHGVHLLAEEFGLHIPRALTAFISSIGPVGSAMAAAFPFLAIVVGATLLLEHLHKLKEEGEKLTESQMHFGITVTNVLNGLNEKLLQAGIRTDELNHNHLAALHKQLELIDHQSMSELVRAFDTVAKAADATFAQLKASWYQIGAGSTGAKHALEDFKLHYEALLESGKDKDASDLLAGTRRSAERILELQKQVRDNQTRTGTQGTHQGDYNKFVAAANELKREGIGYTDKEFESQKNLVDALEAQAQVQEKVNALKAAEKGNADQAEQGREVINLIGRQDKIAALHKKEAAEDEKLAEEKMRLEESITRYFAEEWAKREKLQEEAAMEEARHGEKMRGLKIAAQREQDQLTLSTMRNSGAARVEEEIRIANDELANQLQGNADRMAALVKSDKDYENKLHALQNRKEEMVQEHENRITAIQDKAELDRNRSLLAAGQRMNDSIAKGLTDTLMRHQSFTKTMIQLGNQVAAGMIETALKSILANDMTKISDAKYAARKGWIAGTHFPFPADLVMAPLLAAAGFSAVMAFEGGGMVPGVGKGDVVPAMLEPGETVLTKKLTEGLSNAAQGGGGSITHVHAHYAPQIHAVDAEGVDRMLRTHGDTFQRHFASHVRKMNR